MFQNIGNSSRSKNKGIAKTSGIDGKEVNNSIDQVNR